MGHSCPSCYNQQSRFLRLYSLDLRDFWLYGFDFKQQQKIQTRLFEFFVVLFIVESYPCNWSWLALTLNNSCSFPPLFLSYLPVFTGSHTRLRLGVSRRSTRSIGVLDSGFGTWFWDGSKLGSEMVLNLALIWFGSKLGFDLVLNLVPIWFCFGSNPGFGLVLFWF
jgi:hypothetical protein